MGASPQTDTTLATEQDSDSPEDILSTSLSTLYDYAPIAHTASRFTHTHRTGITTALRTPDTVAANWSLHASAIWASALVLADHIEELGLQSAIDDGNVSKPVTPLRILELGAAAGLPSILISKLHGSDVRVTASDYPDDALLRTLAVNISANDVRDICRPVGYAWGEPVSALIGTEASPLFGPPFDVIIAADTLWNSSLHASFLETLRVSLNRSRSACIHLIAGLHTGRWTLQAFLNAAKDVFEVTSAVERRVSEDGNFPSGNRRPWDVSRGDGGDEDENARRKWVLWITMKWRDSDCD